VKRGHVACAALLNPSSAEPLVWPSALKFISELEPNAKSLLEAALMEANRERERRILKGTKNASPSPSHSDDGAHDAAAIAEVNSIASCIQISPFGAVPPHGILSWNDPSTFLTVCRYDHELPILVKPQVSHTHMHGLEFQRGVTRSKTY